MFGLFKKSAPIHYEPLKVDMHSHLLPGIDDGSEDLETSLELVRKFHELGFEKLITTPHIMGDFFKNTPEIIKAKQKELNHFLEENGLSTKIEIAAEYYLDEWFMEKLNGQEELLTFGDNYLLFETSYINRPGQLEEAIFHMKSLNYKPVIAHPERYTYLYGSYEGFKELYEKEIFFQININSLTGYYSKAAKKFAEKLVDDNMVHFFGSDCHGMKHLNTLEKAQQSKYYKKASSHLLNNTLL